MTMNNTPPPTTKPAMNALTFFPFAPILDVGEDVGEEDVVGAVENGMELVVVFVEVGATSAEAEPLRTIKWSNVKGVVFSLP